MHRLNLNSLKQQPDMSSPMCVCVCVCMVRAKKDNDQRTFFPPKMKTWPSRKRRTTEKNVENQGKPGEKVAPLSLVNNCRLAGETHTHTHIHKDTAERIYQGTLKTFKRRHNKIKRILRISCKLSCPHPCSHAPFFAICSSPCCALVFHSDRVFHSIFNFIILCAYDILLALRPRNNNQKQQ